MANKKSKARKAQDADAANATATASVSAAATASVSPDVSPAPAFFPLARYTSVVGVHTTLLAFATLFLPQTVPALFDPAPSQLTSRDRPQTAFADALTRTPAATAAFVVAGAAVLQPWWAGWLRGWAIDGALVGSDDEMQIEKAAHGARRFSAARDAWLTTLAASVAMHIALVLFGAPVASHALHTYLLALLLSTLTVYAPAYTLGAPTLGSTNSALVTRLTWIRLFAEFAPRNAIERALVFPAVGAVIGCWAGVAPIALDWDRPWQAWPLTPGLGAVVGHIAGSLGAFTASTVHFLANEDIRLRADEGKVKTS